MFQGVGRNRRSLLARRYHPIWRGVGCLLLIIIPFMAYGLAGFALSLYEADLSDPLTDGIVLPILGEVSDLVAVITVTALFSVVLYTLFSVLGSIVYSLAGGPRNEEVSKYSRPGTYDYRNR